MRSIRARLVLSFVLVAVITAAAALNLAIVYFERRLGALPTEMAAVVQSELSVAGGNFDGFWELGWVIAASLVPGVAVAWWLARGLAMPLRRVSTAAGRIATGDLTARAGALGDRSRWRLPVRSRRHDELGRLVDDFDHMSATLQALDRERTAGSAAIAHELRSPLAALTARLHALDDGVLSWEPAQARRLLGQTEILGRLVDDLRTLSLSDAGRLGLTLRTLDLRATVADAVEAHQALATTRSISLRLLEVPDEPVLVHADADRLGQVLGNLIDNALRFTPEAGAVTISVRLDGEVAQITVDDTGPGIPAIDRDRVLDRFSQLDPSRPSNSGSGLGLAVVKAIVSSHRGTVAIDDAPGGGARVSFRLPSGTAARVEP